MTNETIQMTLEQYRRFVAIQYLNAIVVIGFIALVGTALFVAAKGTVRVADSRLLIT